MKKNDKDSNRIAIALIVNDEDNILMGQRKDNQKFTNPSGHIKVGEDPYIGCLRELKEETGLDAESIKLVKVEFNKKKGLLLYLFEVSCDPNQSIDVSGDPDQEFSEASFVDPNDVKDELLVPLSENISIKWWIDN